MTPSRADRRERHVWPRIRALLGDTYGLTTSGGLVILTPGQADVYRSLAQGRTTQRAIAEGAGVPLGSLTHHLIRLHSLRAAWIGTLRGRLGWTVARPQRPGSTLTRFPRRRSWLTPPELAVALFRVDEPDPPPIPPAPEPPAPTSHHAAGLLPRECSLCGASGPDVAPGIGLEGERFVDIDRCRDHDACDRRRGVDSSSR